MINITPFNKLSQAQKENVFYAYREGSIGFSRSTNNALVKKGWLFVNQWKEWRMTEVARTLYQTDADARRFQFETELAWNLEHEELQRWDDFTNWCTDEEWEEVEAAFEKRDKPFHLYPNPALPGDLWEREAHALGAPFGAALYAKIHDARGHDEYIAPLDEFIDVMPVDQLYAALKARQLSAGSVNWKNVADRLYEERGRLMAAVEPLAQFKGVYPGLSWAETVFSYKDKLILYGDIVRAANVSVGADRLYKERKDDDELIALRKALIPFARVGKYATSLPFGPLVHSNGEAIYMRDLVRAAEVLAKYSRDMKE